MVTIQGWERWRDTRRHWWECELLQPPGKVISQCLSTLPVISFVGIYPIETQTMLFKDTCTGIFIAKGEKKKSGK